MLLAFCKCQTGQRLQVWPSTDRGEGEGNKCIVLLTFCSRHDSMRIYISQIFDFYS